ncbi:MAG: Gfo/Idh/MocA family protein, partial [Cypionkella sp.]
VVGAGAIAARHLAVLSEADASVDIVAHLGRSVEAVDAAIQRFGGSGYLDVAAFIASGIDAALITVPPSQHGPIEHALIKARVPFLVEKPIALDAGTALAIAEAAEQYGVLAAAGYNWRALDTLDIVREVIATNSVRMAIGRFHIGTPTAPWWRHQAQSGGQMLEQACHLIDLCRLLLGEGELLGATGSFGPMPQFEDGDIAGTSAALLRFENGVPGVLTATCLLPKSSGVELRLICNALEIVITLLGVEIIANGRSVHHRSVESSYVRQDRAFFAALRSGSADAVYSSYQDAVKTHLLCLGITDAILGCG